MALDVINPAAVRDALRALRYATPLRDSPLLGLDLVACRLRSEQLADTPQGRAWALGRCLEDAVDEQLRLARDSSSSPSAELTAGAELDLLRQDLQSGSAERLDLALLHWRYLSPTHQPVRAVGRALGVAERTIRNRLTRGVDVLTELLRQQEVIAARGVQVEPDARPAERILVDEGASTRGVVELLGELQALLGEHQQVVRISPEQLEAVARYPAAELVAYRLGRIAEWSLPRYRLDSRFVELSLLVDLGEESPSGRWQAREERFTDLRQVLAAVSEPAVVLLGPPGSGKSTLLRRLELDLSVDALGPGDLDVEVAAPLTFLVSLNQYRPAAPGGPLPAPSDWLAERWSARFPKLAPLAEQAAERGVVYLLDGLNEMPHHSAEDYRGRIALWKQFLLETVTPGSGHRAVIACRSLDYSAPLSTPALQVPQVQLEPLSDEKVEAFLARYSPGNAAELWTELAGTKVLEAVRWPFFLRLLVEAAAETGGKQGDLPALLTSYVRRALVREIERHNPRLEPSALLDERDYERIVSGRGWRTPYELPERGDLFRRLAVLAHGMQSAAADEESSQVRIGYDQVIELVGEVDGAAVVRVGTDLGVLDEDRAADEVMFQHQLFQEYFAAREMAVEPEVDPVRQEWRAAEIPPSVSEVIAGLHQYERLPPLPSSGWEETALMAAVMATDPANVVTGLMPANLALAGRAAAQSEVRPRLSDGFLGELRWSLVHRSRDPKADLRDRIACGFVLGELGDPRFERCVGPYGAYLMPPLVEIAGGTYPIGQDDPSQHFFHGTTTNSMPRHTTRIAAFHIGKFPVTNGEYACFIASGGYDDERWWDTAAGCEWRLGIGTGSADRAGVYESAVNFRAKPELMVELVNRGTWNEARLERWRGLIAMTETEMRATLNETFPDRRLTEPAFWRDARINNPLLPVTAVSWYEARAYCAWLADQTGMGIRLPTEVEWEAAARGEVGRTYAYGDQFDASRANTHEMRVMRPTPVGVFPSGDTPEGVADLTSNVEDWTSSLLGAQWKVDEFKYPYRSTDGRENADAGGDVFRVQRGGWWGADGAPKRAADRERDRPGSRALGTGFRIVASSI